MPAAPRLRLTPDAFLDWELHQEERHEYHRGEVFAMAGGTEQHARLITNLVIRLSAALAGSGCTVYTDALGVRVEAEDLFTYPDLSVVCGEPQFFDTRRTRLLNPTALVEVLSPSTEAYDRTTKWRFYSQIPSLQAYVLVDASGPAVDVLVRDGSDWRLTATRHDGEASLPPLGVALSLVALYDGVTWDDPNDDGPRLHPGRPA